MRGVLTFVRYCISVPIISYSSPLSIIISIGPEKNTGRSLFQCAVGEIEICHLIFFEAVTNGSKTPNNNTKFKMALGTYLYTTNVSNLILEKQTCFYCPR